MNGLRKSEVKKLEKLDLADTARKISELINYINEQCFFGKEMTHGICNPIPSIDKGEKKIYVEKLVSEKDVDMGWIFTGLTSELADGMVKVINDYKKMCHKPDKEMTVNVCNGKEASCKNHITGNNGKCINCGEYDNLSEEEKYYQVKKDAYEKSGIRVINLNDCQLHDEKPFSNHKYFMDKAKKDLLKRMIKRSKNEGSLSVIMDEYKNLNENS